MFVLFLVEKIFAALLFEALHIVAPSGFYFGCAASLLNHCANVATAYQLLEEFSEEVENFITVAKQTCNVCVDFRNELISDISKIDKDKVLEFRQNLTLYKTSVGSLSLYLSRLISKIAKEIYDFIVKK